MRVFVLGSGGREHALGWRLDRCDSVSQVTVWPGNGGTALAGWSPAEGTASTDDALELISELAPDLVVIGPEVPLVEGLGDKLREKGIRVFGPGADGARLEGSKIFAKDFMLRHGIPTASSRTVANRPDLEKALADLGERVVLKADGLAAGKGVVLPSNREEALQVGEEMLAGSAFGDAGRHLLVEERLQGFEISMLAICDGERYVLLPPSQDHKRALEGDKGPNTGGMGAFSPVEGPDERALEKVGESVFTATLAGLRKEGIDYRGILYAGLMMTPLGPRVLEFNCRFGDPETQALLPRIDGDFAGLLAAAADGDLGDHELGVRPGAAITVVLASAGYPGEYAVGHPIDGLDAAPNEDVMIFHAGTRREGDKVLTSGGRVLAVTALGDSLPEAAERCYRNIANIKFSGLQFRRDIGWRVLKKGSLC